MPSPRLICKEPLRESQGLESEARDTETVPESREGGKKLNPIVTGTGTEQEEREGEGVQALKLLVGARGFEPPTSCSQSLT